MYVYMYVCIYIYMYVCILFGFVNFLYNNTLTRKKINNEMAEKFE